MRELPVIDHFNEEFSGCIHGFKNRGILKKALFIHLPIGEKKVFLPNS
jgi:hypothetical protein